MSTPISGKLFDGVFRRVLAADVSDPLRAQLSSVGLDLSRAHLDFEYPRTVWYQAVDTTASALFSNDPKERQLRRLGLHLISSLHTRNIVKGTYMSMARLMGPRRALKQALEYVEHSPVKVSVHERSKTEFEILAEELEQAEFLAGLLEGAIGLLGGREARTVVVGPRGRSMVFNATWR